MVKSRAGQSLLSYLNPAGSAISLRIPTAEARASTDRHLAFPFMAVSDSDPLVRVVEAGIQTDSGATVKRVFLLVQKDCVRLPKDDLNPVTNSDIDDLWRDAFSYHCSGARNPPLISLAGQMDEEGRLLPFLPLFYCRSRDLFFHPPCPQCGAALDACRDDALLGSCGLPLYSGSVSRYLYCPSCSSSGLEPRFYAHELSGFDPPVVKDRLDLIRDFSRLVRERPEGTGLPCIGCPGSDECHISGNAASRAVSIFSFHPFYMFVFEAMSLNALDFSALLSGAGFEDLEARLGRSGDAGRRRCACACRKELAGPFFFFEGSDRFFLEVLYLKLTLLVRLIGDALPDPGDPARTVRSFESYWVSLTGGNSLLPAFWNFEAKFLDIFGNRRLLSPDFPAAGRFFLGFFWFHVLLANSVQSAQRVHEAVRDSLDGSRREFEAGCFTGPVFSPENIFWTPAGKVPQKRWQAFWDECVDLGRFLLGAGGSGPDWSKSLFLERLETLRKKISEELFYGAAATPETVHDLPGESKTSVEDDDAIYAILSGILEKWSRDLPAAVSEPEPVGEPEPVREAQYVPAPAPEPEAEPASESPEPEPDFLPRTVLIGASGAEQARSGLSPPEEPPREEELPRTVIIGAPAVEGVRARDARPAPGAVSSDAAGGNDLDRTQLETQDLVATVRLAQPVPETVIISRPRDSAPHQPPPSGAPAPGPSQPPEPPPAAESPKTAATVPLEDDFMTETVILSPAGSKNGKADESD